MTIISIPHSEHLELMELKNQKFNFPQGTENIDDV